MASAKSPLETSKDKQEYFFPRPWNRVYAGNSAPSRPVDLHQVTKRLLEIPAEGTSRGDRPVHSQARTWEDIEEASYAELIKDGGRPCYPASLLVEIASDFRRHTNFTRPWQGIDQGPVTRQRTSWLLFRRWQKYSRKSYTHWGKSEPCKSCEEAHSGFVSRFQLEHAGIPEYAEAVKTLLAEDNFEQPFQFKEDPGTQQDELSTWIEYLAYEYWRYRWCSYTIERLQPDRDEAFKAIKTRQTPQNDKKYRDTLSLYRDTQIRRDRHEAQYKWVRDQVPLVEAGLESGQEPMYKERTPTPPLPTLEEMERESYTKLFADGGRPCYPLRLINEVVKVPGKYPEFAGPWGDSSHSGPVTQQLYFWKGFRMWQSFNRKDLSGWRDTHFRLAKTGYRAFDNEFGIHKVELPVYAQAVATVLAKYDFHLPFQLEVDPKKQDDLSTWIEYLGYEYWLHHSATDDFQRNQERYDEAKGLLDSHWGFGEDMTKHKDTARAYEDAKRQSTLHGKVARWVREQIPLVEAETKAAKTRAATATTPGSSNSRKNNLSADDGGATEAQTMKRTRRSKRTSPPAETAAATPTAR